MLLRYNQIKELLHKLLHKIREHQDDWSELLFALILMLVVMLFLHWLQFLGPTYEEHRLYYFVVWILTPTILFIIKHNHIIFSYLNIDGVKIIRVFSLFITIIISAMLTEDVDFIIAELGLRINLFLWHGWWVLLGIVLEFVITSFYYILIWSIPLVTLAISHGIVQMKKDTLTRRQT